VTVPPVAADDARRRDRAPDDRIIAERRHDKRSVALNQASKRGHIQMVIMIVAKQNGVDRRQIAEINGRDTNTSRTRMGFGLAFSDQNGSVSKLSPRVWISTVA